MPVSAVCADSRGSRRLWSSFKGCSESPLLVLPEIMVSCLLGGPDFFPDFPTASCGILAPFRLCSRSQPQSSPWDLTSEAGASAPSPHLPRQVSRQASRAGECWSALILCAGISLLCLCIPVAALSSVSPKLPPCPPPVSASEGAS